MVAISNSHEIGHIVAKADGFYNKHEYGGYEAHARYHKNSSRIVCIFQIN